MTSASNTQWANNSSGSLGDYGEATESIIFNTSYVAVAILVHSCLLHGCKYDSVRICTDLGCLAAAVSGLCLYVGAQQTSASSPTSVFTFLFYQALGPLMMQLCDSYMFYSRLQVVRRNKIPLYERVLIHSYIWVVLVGTWLPAYTIVPMFYDTNSDEYADVNSILYSIYSFGIILYNFYFTGQCLWVFYKTTRSKVAIGIQEEQRLRERQLQRIKQQQQQQRPDGGSNRIAPQQQAVGNNNNQSATPSPHNLAAAVNNNDHERNRSGTALIVTGKRGGDRKENNNKNNNNNNIGTAFKSSAIVPDGMPTPAGSVSGITGTGVIAYTMSSSGAVAGAAQGQQGGNGHLRTDGGGAEGDGDEDGTNINNMLAGLRRIEIVAIKSIGHAITSSFAALYYTYGGTPGVDSWNLIIILGMHFWFNMPLEGMVELCCGVKTRRNSGKKINRRQLQPPQQPVILAPPPAPPAPPAAPAPHHHRHHHAPPLVTTSGRPVVAVAAVSPRVSSSNNASANMNAMGLLPTGAPHTT